MEPKLESLTDAQRRLWPELSATPYHFTLYGGIAIALRFGHRFSADFDLLSQQAFDPESLYRQIPYLKEASVLQMGANTLTCSVERGEAVKISFFGVPDIRVVEPPEAAVGPNLKVASVLDLAGTEASVIQKRAAARDYLDLDVLMTRGRVDLLTALAAGRLVYGPMFNAQITLKALSYYGDGDLSGVPAEVKARLTEAARTVDLKRLSSRLQELGGT
ncbi:MAG: hypothetical protein AMXMBFR33_11250 [Candidatus Xenobia bacterium]